MEHFVQPPAETTSRHAVSHSPTVEMTHSPKEARIDYNKLFDDAFSSSPPRPPSTQPQPQAPSELLHISPFASSVSTSSLVASHYLTQDHVKPTGPALSTPPRTNRITTLANLDGPPSVQKKSQNITITPDGRVFGPGESRRVTKAPRKRTRSEMETGSPTFNRLLIAQSEPTCRSGPDRDPSSQPLPAAPASNAPSTIDSEADNDSEEPEDPPLYDFATVVIFHDWWVDLRQHNADEWFLMGGAKLEALDSEAQNTLDFLFPLYRRYRTAYSPYEVTLRKFLIACLYVYYTHIDTAPPGERSAASRKRTQEYEQLHPFLWDDFIRCLTVTFPPYVNQCQLDGRVPMSAFQYYNTRVPSPTNRKQVVSQQSLRAFVNGNHVQPVHKIFHRTVGILQSNINLERAMDQARLLVVVDGRRALDTELTEGREALDEFVQEYQREHSRVKLRKEKAERHEKFLEARSAGMECEIGPWKEILRAQPY